MSSMPMTHGSAAATGSTAASALRPPAKTKTIKGVVGPGFTISVSPGAVKASKYKLVISDLSSMHNFHITGPGGIDKATSIPDTGKTVWKLNLVKGTYTIVCDAHATTMKTSLTVS